MLFFRKTVYQVKLQNSETVEQLLIAFAMASYEATPAFFEEEIGAPGSCAREMLNPDLAAHFIKDDDDLTMMYVQGKACLTHVRRVRRHFSQFEPDGVVTLEVLSFEGDLDKLFERAATILRWIADDAPAEGSQFVLDVDAEGIDVIECVEPPPLPASAAGTIAS